MTRTAQATVALIGDGSSCASADDLDTTDVFNKITGCGSRHAKPDTGIDLDFEEMLAKMNSSRLRRLAVLTRSLSGYDFDEFILMFLSR